jgi:hypothetical protein
MSVFEPSISIQNQIRKIIFEKYNDPEIRFTNDEIFEILKNNDDMDKTWTIDNAEIYFQEICDSGLVRNIAQNFTTIWFKLFDIVEKIHCNTCNQDTYIGKLESRVCTNSKCKAAI